MNKLNSIHTLQKLVIARMKEKGLSRSRLIQSIGLKNVSKGLRRLDHYLQTLESPSDELFIVKLLSVLDINGPDFCKSIVATQNKMSGDAMRIFKPYLHILLGINIRPAIAFCAVHNKCMVPVQGMLSDDELFKKVKDNCQEVIVGLYVCEF